MTSGWLRHYRTSGSRPPVRVEVHTEISGVEFSDCHARRITQAIGGIDVPFIALADLLVNTRSSARLKDQADVQALSDPNDA
jgi:hypothetical protein